MLKQIVAGTTIAAVGIGAGFAGGAVYKDKTIDVTQTNEYKHVVEDNQELNTKLDATQITLSGLAKQRDSLEETKVQLETRLETAQLNLNNKTIELEAKQSELKLADEQITALNLQITTLETNAQADANQITFLQEQVANLTTSKQSLETDISNLQKNIEEYAQQVSALQTSISNKDNELNELNEKTKNLLNFINKNNFVTINTSGEFSVIQLGNKIFYTTGSSGSSMNVYVYDLTTNALKSLIEDIKNIARVTYVTPQLKSKTERLSSGIVYNEFNNCTYLSIQTEDGNWRIARYNHKTDDIFYYSNVFNEHCSILCDDESIYVENGGGLKKKLYVIDEDQLNYKLNTDGYMVITKIGEQRIYRTDNGSTVSYYIKKEGNFIKIVSGVSPRMMYLLDEENLFYSTKTGIYSFNIKTGDFETWHTFDTARSSDPSVFLKINNDKFLLIYINKDYAYTFEKSTKTITPITIPSGFIDLLSNPHSQIGYFSNNLDLSMDIIYNDGKIIEFAPSFESTPTIFSFDVENNELTAKKYFNNNSKMGYKIIRYDDKYIFFTKPVDEACICISIYDQSGTSTYGERKYINNISDGNALKLLYIMTDVKISNGNILISFSDNAACSEKLIYKFDPVSKDFSIAQYRLN